MVEVGRARYSTSVANEPIQPLNSTGYLLGRIGAAARRRFNQALAEYGLRTQHYEMLVVLTYQTDGGVMSQRDLARTIGVDGRNAASLLDDLEERQLVSRGSSPRDRRRHAVVVTLNGVAILGRLQDASGQVEEKLLAGLSQADRQDLHRLLLALLPAAAGDDQAVE